MMPSYAVIYVIGFMHKSQSKNK